MGLQEAPPSFFSLDNSWEQRGAGLLRSLVLNNPCLEVEEGGCVSILVDDELSVVAFAPRIEGDHLSSALVLIPNISYLEAKPSVP